MHQRQQALLCLLFGAGLVVCFAGTVRIYYTWKTTSTFDRTWLSFGLFISTVIELDLGIVRDEDPLPQVFSTDTLNRFALRSLLASPFSPTISLLSLVHPFLAASLQSNTTQRESPIRKSKGQGELQPY